MHFSGYLSAAENNMVLTKPLLHTGNPMPETTPTIAKLMA
jgi:hypothetical protein